MREKAGEQNIISISRKASPNPQRQATALTAKEDLVDHSLMHHPLRSHLVRHIGLSRSEGQLEESLHVSARLSCATSTIKLWDHQLT